VRVLPCRRVTPPHTGRTRLPLAKTK
jgi:hypothetical protein